MSTYCTQADIENRWGTVNTIAWSNIDADDITTANAARIAAAIEWASETIDDELRGGPYTLPLTSPTGGTPATAKHIATELAGYWLYISRGARDTEFGEEMERLHTMDLEKLNEYKSGQRSMNAARVKHASNFPFVVRA